MSKVVKLKHSEEFEKKAAKNLGLKVTLNHDDLINLICGIEIFHPELCTKLTEVGVMKNIGQPFAPKWEFIREELDAFSDKELLTTYRELTK